MSDIDLAIPAILRRDGEDRFHPLAGIFPLIDDAGFADLVADIQANGLIEPIVEYEGKILDGRNRYRACLDAKVEPRFTTYSGDDPLGFVLSLNLRRRHLSESQRAMVAAKIADMPAHRPDDKSANLRASQSEAAALLNVSTRIVTSAARVTETGAPELQAAVEQGRASVSAAADVASLPKEVQAAIVAKGEKEIVNASNRVKAGKKKPVAAPVPTEAPISQKDRVVRDVRNAILQLRGTWPPKAMFAAFDGTVDADLVDESIVQACQWLTEFTQIWCRKRPGTIGRVLTESTGEIGGPQ